MGKWYLKTFRIFDSPDKDVPDKQVIEGSYNIALANVFIKAHNKDVKSQESELDTVKTALKNYGRHIPQCAVIISEGYDRTCSCGFRKALQALERMG